MPPSEKPCSRQWLKDNASVNSGFSGVAHESRVSLSVSVAAILRGLDIPRVYISGFGANYYYPSRVFAAAIRILKKKWGRSPIELESYGGHTRRVRMSW